MKFNLKQAYEWIQENDNTSIESYSLVKNGDGTLTIYYFEISGKHIEVK